MRGIVGEPRANPTSAMGLALKIVRGGRRGNETFRRRGD